jgi:4-hydroxybenzoyl-CoA thioesterase
MGRFETSRTLRFGECDPAGIAYFPRYFEMLNGVVEEWWTALGFPWTGLILQRRIGLPTAHLESDFRAPAIFGDCLSFALEIETVGSRSLALRHTVRRDETLLWEARQTVVATSLDTHKSIAWPDDIRAALVSFQEFGFDA